MARRYKKDNNQNDIVDALRAIGASVQETHRAGNGFPDIVVGFRGKNYLLEIKNPEFSNSKLLDTQKKWHKTWCGQVCVVETPDQAIEVITNVSENT